MTFFAYRKEMRVIHSNKTIIGENLSIGFFSYFVKNVDILSRTYAMKNSMFEVLTSYDETMHYLEIPGWLSEASDIGYQYGGFSEHLMMSLTDIFCFKDR